MALTEAGLEFDLGIVHKAMISAVGIPKSSLTHYDGMPGPLVYVILIKQYFDWSWHILLLQCQYMWYLQTFESITPDLRFSLVAES